ncbi:MAG: hypothetical protein WCY62_01335 [Clostridia bacterium]
MAEKKDLELFGLNESYSKKDLEHAYEMILRRAKLDPSMKVDEVNAAYDRILGIKKIIVSEEEQLKRKGKMKLSDNMPFIIAGAVVVLILAIMIPTLAAKKAVDLHVGFAGEYTVSETESLVSLIRPDVKAKKTSIEVIYCSFDSGNDIGAAGLTALSLSLIGADYDLIVADSSIYTYLTGAIGEVMVRDLTEYLDDMGLSSNDPRLLRSGSEIYGIDASASSIFSQIGTTDGKFYLVIPNKLVEVENAVTAIIEIIGE